MALSGLHWVILLAYSLMSKLWHFIIPWFCLFCSVWWILNSTTRVSNLVGFQETTLMSSLSFFYQLTPPHTHAHTYQGCRTEKQHRPGIIWVPGNQRSKGQLLTSGACSQVEDTEKWILDYGVITAAQIYRSSPTYDGSNYNFQLYNGVKVIHIQ